MKEYTWNEVLERLEIAHKYDDINLAFNGYYRVYETYEAFPYDRYYITNNIFGDIKLFINDENVMLSAKHLNTLHSMKFKRILSHNEKLIEKWNKVEIDTPVEIMYTESTSKLGYFKKLIKNYHDEYIFVLSVYKNDITKSKEYLSKIFYGTKCKLLSDTEFDEFE